MSDYQFTQRWFEEIPKPVWEELIPQLWPARVLEVGSYEGASTCYLIEKLTPVHALEIHCVDTWAGGLEHQADGQAPARMGAVEARFHHNTATAVARAPSGVELVLHKGQSDLQLARLLSGGKAGYFDFIYIDGSHQAPDVLCDAVLGFRLLRIGGIMVFDDYLWAESLPHGKDPIRCVKPAVDAFTTLYCRKLEIIQAPLYQLYVVKTAD